MMCVLYVCGTVCVCLCAYMYVSAIICNAFEIHVRYM